MRTWTRLRCVRDGLLDLSTDTSGRVGAPNSLQLHEMGGREVVLVCDKISPRVVAVDTDGKLVAEATDGAGGGSGLFTNPYDLAVLPTTGDVLVADGGKKQIVVLRGSDLALVSMVLVDKYLTAVCTDAESGRVFVGEWSTHGVHEVDLSLGECVHSVGGGRGLKQEAFRFPAGLAHNSDRQELFVSDTNHRAVVVLSTAGGGLDMEQRIALGFVPSRPLLHPVSGNVLVYASKNGESRACTVDVATGRVSWVRGDGLEHVQSLCWVPSKQEVWATFSHRTRRRVMQLGTQ